MSARFVNATTGGACLRWSLTRRVSPLFRERSALFVVIPYDNVRCHVSKRYEMRQGPDDLWEIFDVMTGEIIKMGGVLLSGLDLDAAKGALDVLANEVVQPNGAPEEPSGSGSV